MTATIPEEKNEIVLDGFVRRTGTLKPGLKPLFHLFWDMSRRMSNNGCVSQGL